MVGTVQEGGDRCGPTAGADLYPLGPYVPARETD